MTISIDTLVERNEDVLFSDVADGMSLMDIESGQYFHFDQTGARIWKAIEGSVAVKDICAGLMAEYDVDADTCSKDTMEFVGELDALGLIQTKS